MNKNEIAVFICEDDDVAREIVSRYLKSGQVTYAEFIDANKRGALVNALKTL